MRKRNKPAIVRPKPARPAPDPVPLIVKQDGEYPGAHPRTRLRTIDDLDGRTFAAREARKLIAELERDLGGDLSVAQRELVKRAAVLGAIISDHEVAWLEHRPSDLTTYGTLVDRQRPSLRR